MSIFPKFYRLSAHNAQAEGSLFKPKDRGKKRARTVSGSGLSSHRVLSGDVLQFGFGGDAQCKADVAGQFGPVQSVEMQFVHAAFDQVRTQLGA